MGVLAQVVCLENALERNLEGGREKGGGKGRIKQSVTSAEI